MLIFLYKFDIFFIQILIRIPNLITLWSDKMRLKIFGKIFYYFIHISNFIAILNYNDALNNC